MEVLTKSMPSNSVLEVQKQSKTSFNTLDFFNGKGEKTVFDIHHYGKKGVLYFKKK